MGQNINDTSALTCRLGSHKPLPAVAYSGILFRGGGSTNTVEDRGQRERGFEAVAP